MGAAARRRAIRALIGTGEMHSQGELLRRLEEAGHRVSQSTVSRDLEAIGARKTPDGRGPGHYVVEEDRPADEPALERVLAEHVTASVASANLLVLHTAPGAAHVVALALDRSDLEEIAGTVAGDDTVLVVAAEGRRGEDLARALEALGDR